LLVFGLAACGDAAVGVADALHDTSGGTDTAVVVTIADTTSDADAAATEAPDTLVADTLEGADTFAVDATVEDTAAADTTIEDTLVATADTSNDDTSTFVGCPPAPCDTPLPDLGAVQAWRHTVATPITTFQGDPRHRGQDLYLAPNDPQWALAKFAYGPFDDDLTDEDVDIYALVGCGASWIYLATATTTDDDEHATVEGVADSGGRVYYELPASQRLGLGRHRLAFVVRGDHSVAYQTIEVLPADAAIVVSDVDGTQTSSETAEFGAVFLGVDPEARPYGADVLTAFAERGFHIFYLTARPEWLHARTHEWLAAHGYPPGVVHTSFSFTGVNGADASAYKLAELDALDDRLPGAVMFTIGNTDTDAAAFSDAGVPPDHSYLYQYDPGPLGTEVDDYATLLPVARAQLSHCE